ncbi:MAG: hypothetical protein IJI98_11175 [Methanosphaera sp.]|nr:hypothetical protein [Methanosphaera sp.]
MIKQYFIVDLNSDYKNLMDYKEMKNLLIETIQEDLLMNSGEYEIVKDCSDELIKMAKEDFTNVKWITDLLESYSYKTIDLLDFQRDLEDLKQYFEKDYFIGAFNEILNKINSEVNKHE